MPPDVKGVRPYRSPQRAASAQETRRAILDAAESAFLSDGFAASTVTGIAAAAGVNVDTLYTSVGRKAQILRELVEAAISGEDHAVPALDRPYVQAIRKASTAREKIAIYADAVARMGPRTAPIFAVLTQAAGSDETCRALAEELADRRAANMRLFAADLRATGSLREDLSDAQVADIVWSFNSPECFTLLVSGRGWTPSEFADYLRDAWCRMLLDDPVG